MFNSAVGLIGGQLSDNYSLLPRQQHSLKHQTGSSVSEQQNMCVCVGQLGPIINLFKDQNDKNLPVL